MILFGILILYILLCLFMAIGFLNYPPAKTNYFSEDLHFSIVIAARNEEGKIKQCIHSIAEQQYPKQNYEVIIVSDASADQTVALASEELLRFGITHRILINEHHLGKKKSLIKAIQNSKYDVIITRDADTITHTANWLASISSCMVQTKKEFIICPVAITHQNKFLSALQEVETAILGIFAVASTFFKLPYLCSGANLVFTKRLFHETNHYSSHLKEASGDDVFFLDEVRQKEPNQIIFLKNADALVFTYPEKSLQSLIHQKVRWSGKLFKISNWLNWASAIIIALGNVSMIYFIFEIIFCGFNAKMALFFVILKLLIDILLVFLASRFVKVSSNWMLVGSIAIVYPFYALLVAISTTFIEPKWKTK